MKKWVAGLCLLLAAPLWAQIVTGSIVGTVVDASGLVVPGVDVSLVQVSTARQRQTKTNELGSFIFSGLDAGLYTLTVASSGFKKYEKRDIRLATGERLPLGKVQLEVGALTEVVSVTSRGGAMV